MGEYSRQLVIDAMRELDTVRRHKGIKQQVLCAQIGISTKTYAAFMRGECNRLDVFLALNKVLAEVYETHEGYAISCLYLS